MAVTVTSIGTGSGLSGSVAVTLAGSASAGDVVLLAWCTQNGTGMTACTDSKGNTYTVVKSAAKGTTLSAGYAISTVAVGLAPGDTVTVSGGPLSSAAAVCDVAGMSTTADGAASGSGFSTTPAVTGPTTTNANDVLFALVGNDFGYTAPSVQDPTYTTLAGANETTNEAIALAYKTVSSAGAQSYSATMSPAPDWAAAVVAFQQSGGGGPSGLPHTGFLSNTGGMMNGGVH